MDLLESDASGLEGRLHGVRAVGEVVQAIWALSRAQLPRAEEAVAEATLYRDWVDGVVERLAGDPILEENAPRLALVLGPERPFASALVHEMVRVVRRLKAEAPRVTRFAAIGTRFAEALSADAEASDADLAFRLPGPSSVAELSSASDDATIAVMQHLDGAQVELWYASERGVRHVVVIGAARAPSSATPPDTYSSPATILADAVPESVRGRLRVALAESLRAEIHTRVLASERARRAVDRRTEELEQTLRLMRQQQITRELCDLYAGTLAGAK